MSRRGLQRWGWGTELGREPGDGWILLCASCHQTGLGAEDWSLAMTLRCLSRKASLMANQTRCPYQPPPIFCLPTQLTNLPSPALHLPQLIL